MGLAPYVLRTRKSEVVMTSFLSYTPEPRAVNPEVAVGMPRIGSPCPRPFSRNPSVVLRTERALREGTPSRIRRQSAEHQPHTARGRHSPVATDQATPTTRPPRVQAADLHANTDPQTLSCVAACELERALKPHARACACMHTTHAAPRLLARTHTCGVFREAREQRRCRGCGNGAWLREHRRQALS